MGPPAHTVLVTGATGFIGRAVVARFARDGHRVIAGSRSALLPARGLPAGVRALALDITRPETIAAAIAEVDVVIHTAARVGEWGPPADFHATILAGTKNLIAVCATQPLRRFVHLSSTIFYGLRGSGVMTESMLPGDCRWPCAEAKVAAEAEVRRAHRDQDLPAVILRPANVFGPGSPHWTERPAALLRRGSLILPHDAGAANLVYIDNLVEAIVSVVQHDAAVGEIFNVVDDTDLTWAELFGTYAAALDRPPVTTRPPWFLYTLASLLEARATVTGAAPLLTRNAVDYLRFRGSYAPTRLRERLGFEAPVPLPQALANTAESLRHRSR